MQNHDEDIKVTPPTRNCELLKHKVARILAIRTVVTKTIEAELEI